MEVLQHERLEILHCHDSLIEFFMRRLEDFASV
jgi:hypothetical protein